MMVPQINKILFTTDLSEESRQAFEYAISLADRYGARITILYVIEEFSKSANAYLKSFVGDDRWKEIQADHEREARQILIGKQKEGVLIRDALNQFCEEAQKDYSECSYVVEDIVVAKGNVVEEILSQAQASQCDVIVMGYHVKGKFEEAVLGSTTRRLLRRSKIPVMLVRLQKPAH
jgi:nucleotide-binding universal stress UspA family protein